MKLYFHANGVFGLALIVVAVWMIIDAQNGSNSESPNDFVKDNVKQLFEAEGWLGIACLIQAVITILNSTLMLNIGDFRMWFNTLDHSKLTLVKLGIRTAPLLSVSASVFILCLLG